MAVPKFIMKLAAKRAVKKIEKKLDGVGKFMLSDLQKTSKKEIKDKLRTRTEEQKKKVAAGSTNDFVKAEASYTKKDIRKEARNIKRAGLDGPKSTLASTLRTESPLAKYKCSYNSKKKSKKSSLTKTAFGSLSVEAGIDKNHNATQADRIVGAQKNK